MSYVKFVKYIEGYGFKFHRKGKGHNIYKNEILNETFSVPIHHKIKFGIIWNFNRKYVKEKV